MKYLLLCLFIPGLFIWNVDSVFSQQDQPFVTIWETTNEGVSGDDQIQIPAPSQTYEVRWERVGNHQIYGSDTLNGTATLTFPDTGQYRVRISPEGFNQIRFNNSGDRLKLIRIEQWGDVEWSSMQEAFFGCSNMDITAKDTPNLSGVTTLRGMFRDCSSLEGGEANWDWDVDSVEVMWNMFNGAEQFNQDVSGWNVGNVWHMGFMFNEATSFNQDIGSWNLSSLYFASSMLDSSGLDCSNYSATLIGWSENDNTPRNISLGASGLFYSNEDGKSARDYLINHLEWNIFWDLQAEELTIVAPPEDALVCRGDTAVFYVEAHGQDLRYQWQFLRIGGSDWIELANENKDSLLISRNATHYESGRQFRVIITDACGEVDTSSPAELTINEPIQITSHPADSVVVCSGESIDFSIETVGDSLSYLWQFSEGGNQWEDIPGEEDPKISLNSDDAPFYKNGNIRVVVSAFVCPSDTSEVGQIRIKEPPQIKGHPETAEICDGTIPEFTAMAVGESPFNFKWQFLVDENQWMDIPNEDGSGISLEPDSDFYRSGYIRVIADGECEPSDTSQIAGITIVSSDRESSEFSVCANQLTQRVWADNEEIDEDNLQNILLLGDQFILTASEGSMLLNIKDESASISCLDTIDIRAIEIFPDLIPSIWRSIFLVNGDSLTLYELEVADAEDFNFKWGMLHLEGDEYKETYFEDEQSHFFIADESAGKRIIFCDLNAKNSEEECPVRVYEEPLSRELLASLRTSQIDETETPDEIMVNIFPNPGTNSINLSFKGLSSNKLSYELYHVKGQLMYSGKLNYGESTANSTLQMDASELPKGVYVLRFRETDGEGRTVYRRWIKQ